MPMLNALTQKPMAAQTNQGPTMSATWQPASGQGQHPAFMGGYGAQAQPYQMNAFRPMGMGQRPQHPAFMGGGGQQRRGFGWGPRGRY